MKKQIAVTVMLSALLASEVLAHPGHGNSNPLSPGHYVSNPEHAIQLSLMIAVVVIAVNWLASKIEWRIKKK